MTVPGTVVMDIPLLGIQLDALGPHVAGLGHHGAEIYRVHRHFHAGRPRRRDAGLKFPPTRPVHDRPGIIQRRTRRTLEGVRTGAGTFF